MCQIGSFYAGAMGEARQIELKHAWDATGADLAVISAYDPDSMVQHSTECRERGYRFVADPSQQIARMDGKQLLELIEGADMLFTNDYERQLLESKTGLTDDQVLDRVNVRVTTLGSKGVEIVGREVEAVHVPVAKENAKVDPTGVGDAFRAGFLTGLAADLGLRHSAELGSMLATYVIETVGTQEYQVKGPDFAERLAASYGDDCAAEILPHLPA
jgi:adenosine kinase